MGIQQLEENITSIIAIREVTPHVGKEELAENGIRRDAGVMARHGAFTRMFKVIAGAGARALNLQSFYSSFAEGVAAFKIFSADPEFHALFK